MNKGLTADWWQAGHHMVLHGLSSLEGVWNRQAGGSAIHPAMKQHKVAYGDPSHSLKLLDRLPPRVDLSSCHQVIFASLIDNCSCTTT